MSHRHRPNLLLLLLATLAAIGLVLQLQHRQSENPTLIRARELSTSRASSPLPSVSSPAAAPNSFQTIGSTTLADYATPNTTPEQDLASLAQLMNNFTLLVKTANDHPLSSNEEWSQALRGLNPSRQSFLPDNHPVFNTQHQLIDRWGTPLFFHAEAKGQYAIRSAGPDRQLWTSDDLQRNPDGTITRGADLNSVTVPSRSH
jgi:hypothetical protein